MSADRMISLTTAGNQAALALITDLYAQVLNLRTELDEERQQHTAQVEDLLRQLNGLRAAVRTEAGVPTDQA